MWKGLFITLSLLAGFTACCHCPTPQPPPVPPPPPAGFAGIPWRTCTQLNPTVCSKTNFRASPLGQMTDGTNPANAELKYIFTTTGACQGNVCRAELASGHQCKNGDTVACTLTDSGLNGNSTCANGAWGACQ